MTSMEALRYYRERVAARLEEAGLPLRRRCLIVFERGPAGEPCPEGYGEGGFIKFVSTEEFRSLAWSGPPVVLTEAGTWAGPGRQRALVAVRGATLDGFCWCESESADLRFFDLIPALPPRTAYFSRMWVVPEQRSAGIGRKLLRAATAHAETWGFERLLIACDPRNARVRRMASDLGWRPLQRVDYLRVGPFLRYSITRPGGRSRGITSREEAGAKLFACRGAASHE